MPKLKCEPVAIVAAVQTLLVSAMVLLSAFEAWSPTDTQRDAILGAYAAVSALAMMLVRGVVTPTERVGLLKSDIELIEAGQNHPEA